MEMDLMKRLEMVLKLAYWAYFLGYQYLLLDGLEVRHPSLDDSVAHYRTSLDHLAPCIRHELEEHNHGDQREAQQVQYFRIYYERILGIEKVRQSCDYCLVQLVL
jgi:hypothetical protein